MEALIFYHFIVKFKQYFDEFIIEKFLFLDEYFIELKLFILKLLKLNFKNYPMKNKILELFR